MRRKMGFISAGLVAVMTMGAMALWTGPVRGAEKCDPLPHVDWWNTSHEKIIKFVEVKHKGEWRPYIEDWEKQLKLLRQLKNSGRSAYIRSRKLTLEGDDLQAYIDKVAKRIEITKCLRNNYLAAKVGGDKPAAPVTGFGKGRVFKKQAASQPTRKLAARKNADVAQVNDHDMNLQIATSCIGTTAVFEVSNHGERWPRLGTVAVYQVDGKKVMTKRKMRLAKNQIITFRLAERDKSYKGDIGIFIEPSWFERGFKFDATINCKQSKTG